MGGQWDILARFVLRPVFLLVIGENWLLCGAWLLAAALTGLCREARSVCRILDHPTARSLHSHPIPRAGGLAFLTSLVVFVSVAVGLGWLVPGNFVWLGGSMLVVALLSLWDDVRGLPALVRLLVHLAVAGVLVRQGFAIDSLHLPGVVIRVPTWVGLGFSFLFLTWMINLYNFMDGMDGLAASMAVVGFGTLGFLGAEAGDSVYALLCFLVAASVGGFLPWNLPSASIFMGDVGSASLGLLAGGLSLWGDRRGLFPLWVALLIFSPFLVDASLTLLRRAWHREPVWQSHRTHCYQRLVVSGWSQRRTLAWALVLMSACATSACWLAFASLFTQCLGLAAWGLLYLALVLKARRLPVGNP